MAQTQFKLEGGADLGRALGELSKAVSARVRRESLLAAGVPVQRAAADNAHRTEGAGPHLADNIAIGLERGEDAQELHATIGPERRPDFIFWGYFEEFGTIHQPAHPFLRPAFDEAALRSLGILKTWMWHEIKRRIPRGR